MQRSRASKKAASEHVCFFFWFLQLPLWAKDKIDLESHFCLSFAVWPKKESEPTMADYDKLLTAYAEVCVCVCVCDAEVSVCLCVCVCVCVCMMPR